MSDIKIEPMSIDQLAGSFVLIMGAIGSLLLVVWQSRCECDLNLCYIIRCHRKPPPDEKIKKNKDKGQAKDTEKGEDKILDKEEEILDEVKPKSKRTPTRSPSLSPEPEPELELVPDNP